MKTGDSQKTKYAVIDITNNVLSIVDMPYKLISSNGEYELFNIIEDPTETINIAEIYPELVEKYSQNYPIYQGEKIDHYPFQRF